VLLDTPSFFSSGNFLLFFPTTRGLLGKSLLFPHQKNSLTTSVFKTTRVAFPFFFSRKNPLPPSLEGRVTGKFSQQEGRRLFFLRSPLKPPLTFFQGGRLFPFSFDFFPLFSSLSPYVLHNVFGPKHLRSLLFFPFLPRPKPCQSWADGPFFFPFSHRLGFLFPPDVEDLSFSRHRAVFCLPGCTVSIPLFKRPGIFFFFLRGKPLPS